MNNRRLLSSDDIKKLNDKFSCVRRAIDINNNRAEVVLHDSDCYEYYQIGQEEPVCAECSGKLIHKPAFIRSIRYSFSLYYFYDGVEVWFLYCFYNPIKHEFHINTKISFIGVD